MRCRERREGEVGMEGGREGGKAGREGGEKEKYIREKRD